jgi:hypothetical protein
MDIQLATLAVIALLFGGALIGFFLTKTDGFGKYTTASLLFILVLFIAATAFFQGKVETASFINLLAAVAGFAGGLFTAKEA